LLHKANVVSTIRFLARRSLALRGDGDETDVNFNQLLKLHGENDPKILDWTNGTICTTRDRSPFLLNSVAREGSVLSLNCC
ncbi:hypothetical protein ScPMuIL_007940, partial [Solemya velum]